MQGAGNKLTQEKRGSVAARGVGASSSFAHIGGRDHERPRRTSRLINRVRQTASPGDPEVAVAGAGADLAALRGGPDSWPGHIGAARFAHSNPGGRKT